MYTKGCPWLVIFNICYSGARLVLTSKGRPDLYCSLSAVSTWEEPRRPGWLCHSLV